MWDIKTYMAGLNVLDGPRRVGMLLLGCMQLLDSDWPNSMRKSGALILVSTLMYSIGAAWRTFSAPPGLPVPLPNGEPPVKYPAPPPPLSLL